MTAAWPGTLTGYRRQDGRVGVRNYVVVMAAADNVNPLARRLAEAVKGVVSVPASYGRGQLGEDFEVTLRSMAGLATHPNVAACLVLSFEPESGERVLARAGARAGDLAALSLLNIGGMSAAMKEGARILRRFKKQAAACERVPVTVADLFVGLECGGSDTTSGLFGNPSLGVFSDRLIDAGGTASFSEPVECLGGEGQLDARAASPEAAAAMRRAIRHYEAVARAQGVDLAGVNPTPDNLAGGLTTIEEKSLGAIAKSGTRPIQGVLGYGEAPRARGLWLMDAPAAAVENLTALAAAGAQVLMFVTGSGNPVGHPLAPTIKICANPETMASGIAEHVDVDLSDGLGGAFSTADGGRRIADIFAAVVNGADTAAERLGYLATNISRFGESV